MSVEITTLDNGIRIASLKMPALETVSVGIYADAGTRFEDTGCIGISHMFEHMVFKGTKKRSARRIAEEIEAVGGHLNAYTTRDMTAYYARVLKEDLGLAVDMLSDLLSNAVFSAGEVQREQEVICQEIGQANDTPDDIVFDHLQGVAFKGQPLGFSILGTTDSVRAMTSADLKAYRNRFYQGSSLVLTAAGNVDHDDLVQYGEQVLAKLPRGQKIKPKDAHYIGGDCRDVRDLEQVHLCFALEGVPFASDQIYALQLYAAILGGGMSSRLFQEIREDRGLAYAIYADVSAHADTGLLSVYAGTSAEEAPQALRLSAQIMRSLTDDVSGPELGRAKAQLKAGLAMALESSTALSEQMGRHMIMFDRVLPASEILERVDGVTLRDVKDIAETLLSRGPLSFASVGPGQALVDHEAMDQMFRA